MKKCFLIISLLFVISCQEQEARKPLYQSGNSGMIQSIERNKKINAQQQALFQQIIKKDSLLSFISSPAGYWYAYTTKSNQSIQPQRGDQVKFNYSIQSLEGTPLYNTEELGTVDYLVDKEELLPALRYAVKDLSVGDIGVFLVPSFLGYGYQGDGEKIGINQPLRFTVELINLKQNTNPKDSK
ncbi:MAG: gliding motility-associated peptidyl-prolyl isomerase GldI [Flavobacteriaceae bacterium]